MADVLITKAPFSKDVLKLGILDLALKLGWPREIWLITLSDPGEVS